MAKMREGRNGGKLKTGGVHPNAGRPKNISIDLKNEIKRLLNEKTKSGATGLEIMIKGLMAAAAKGNEKAFKELLEWVFSKDEKEDDKKQQWPASITFQVHSSEPTEPSNGE